MNHDTIKDEIIKRIECFDFNDIFVCDCFSDEKYSYQEVLSMAAAVADDFLEDYNIVCMDNGIKLLILYFAALIKNVVIIPIDPEKREDEKTRIINEFPKAKVINDISINRNAIYTKNEIIEKFVKIDYNKDFLITFTSGSAGNPKGVVHSSSNLFHSALCFAEKIGYDNCIRMGHVMPMSYMAGILNTIILPFIVGGKVILMERFSAKNAFGFWNIFMKYDVNAIWLSPTMLHLVMMVDRETRVIEYLKDKKMFISVGTAPLSPTLKEKFEEKYSIAIYQSYGLSETLFVSTANNQYNDKDSVGAVLDDVIIQFKEDKEILVDVPWMFKRYIGVDTASYFDSEMYMTGDWGRILNDELYISGRKKELIIKGGININPKDIEDCLSKIEGIEEVCVGSKVIGHEERIICWYTGKRVEEKLINEIIEKELGNYYKIDFFDYRESLYKNLNGKLDKKRLIEEFTI